MPLIFGVRSDVRDVDRALLHHGPSGRRAAVQSGRMFHGELTEVGVDAVHCRQTKKSAFESPNEGGVRLAQPSSRFYQRVEHSLQIERRAADHLEYVGGSGLLRQRLAQLVEQDRKSVV